jgi:hypothetical protein
MKITEFKSDISNGNFLVRFTFEDDTDVFLDENGFECINYNNIKSDIYYIDIAKKYYNNLNK